MNEQVNHELIKNILSVKDELLKFLNNSIIKPYSSSLCFYFATNLETINYLCENHDFRMLRGDNSCTLYLGTKFGIVEPHIFSRIHVYLEQIKTPQLSIYEAEIQKRDSQN